MAKTIYQTLMQEKSRVGISPVSFMQYDKAGEITISSSRYPFVFVLQGELRCYFSGAIKQQYLLLKKGDMSVIGTKQVTRCSCTAETIIMRYEPPLPMISVMESTSKAFSLPCSEIIPMNDQLQEWCYQQLAYYTDHPEATPYHSCQKIVAMLLNYSREVLGTLYIPLYACFLKCSSCNVCRVLD